MKVYDISYPAQSQIGTIVLGDSVWIEPVFNREAETHDWLGIEGAQVAWDILKILKDFGFTMACLCDSVSILVLERFVAILFVFGCFFSF